MEEKTSTRNLGLVGDVFKLEAAVGEKCQLPSLEAKGDGLCDRRAQRHSGRTSGSPFYSSCVSTWLD